MEASVQVTRDIWDRSAVSTYSQARGRVLGQRQFRLMDDIGPFVIELNADSSDSSDRND